MAYQAVTSDRISNSAGVLSDLAHQHACRRRLDGQTAEEIAEFLQAPLTVVAEALRRRPRMSGSARWGSPLA